MKADNSVIGLNIKYYRKRIKLSQDDLANISGIARSKIAKIESGIQGVKANEINLFATALGIDANELLTGDNINFDISQRAYKTLHEKRKSKTDQNEEIIKVLNKIADTLGEICDCQRRIFNLSRSYPGKEDKHEGRI